MTSVGDARAASVRARHQVWADMVGSRLKLKQLVAATELLNELADVLNAEEE